MKKLLALVLCVMMFVSVLPTAAFAGSATGEVDDPLHSVAAYNKEITNMIKNTKKNVEKAYKTLVGDKVVYTSVKAMDDTLKDMVNGITDNLIEKGTKKADGTRWSKADADRIKGYVRSYLDEAVATKIADNYYKCLDSDGNRDDLKYAQLVADSVNKALNDKQFIAGYQAVATYFALGQVVTDINDKLKDEYEDFQNSIDTSFQRDFATLYPTLYFGDFIDTVESAARKSALKANNETTHDAQLAYIALELLANQEKADQDWQDAYDEAEADYDEATLIPQMEKEAAEEIAELNREAADADSLTTKEEADAEAEKKYKWSLKKAEELEEPEKEIAIIKAETLYAKRLAQNEIAYQAELDDNYDAYLDELDAAQDAYDVATADAQDIRDAIEGAADDKLVEDLAAAQDAYDFQKELIDMNYNVIKNMEINPWGEVVYSHIGSAS